jgi:hypothetical protein
MTATPRSVAVAARMGDRAGRRFLELGVMPRCPFKVTHPELALAWYRACADVIAAELDRRRPTTSKEAPNEV